MTTIEIEMMMIMVDVISLSLFTGIITLALFGFKIDEEINGIN